MKKYGRKCLTFLLAVLCAMLFLSLPALGDNAESSEMVLQTYGVHEVVLLLDISSSMGLADPEFLAPDALRQLTSSVPSYRHVGLVTFNADVADVVPPDISAREEINTVLKDVSYTGHANPGAGLLQAAGLFSDRALSRTIVFFTSSPASATTVIPGVAQLTEQAIEKITESDIQVNIAMVGSCREHFCERILNLPQASGGQLFLYSTPEQLSTIANLIMSNVFGITRTSVHHNAGGGFTAHIPAQGLDFARILIMSESAVSNVVVHGDYESVTTHTGRRFAVVEVLEPASQTIDIEFTTVGINLAHMLLEWDLQLMAGIDDDGAEILWFRDSRGENAFLNPFFQQEFFPISVDGAELQLCAAESGHLHWDMGAQTALQILRTQLMRRGISIPDSAEMPVRFEIPSYAEELEPGETDENELENAVERDFDNIWTIGLIALGVLIIVPVVCLCVFRKKETEDEPDSTAKKPVGTQKKPVQSKKNLVDAKKKPIQPEKKPVEAPKKSVDVKKKPVEAPAKPVAPPQKPVEAPAKPVVLTAPVKQDAPAADSVPVAQSGDKPLEFGSKFGSTEFNGKLDFYMSALSDSADALPRTFQLSRRGKPQEKSLQEIIKKFKLSNPFLGSDKIFFATNEQGELQVKNGSSCTVSIGTDTIVGTDYSTLQQGESIRVRDKFGLREITITPQFS